MARKRSRTKKSSPSSLTLAIIAASFSILGYFGISYITHSNTPIVADITPYDNSQKNTDVRTTWNKPAQSTNTNNNAAFKSANQVLVDQEIALDKRAQKSIIDASKKDDASDAVIQAAARIEAKQTSSSEEDLTQEDEEEPSTCQPGDCVDFYGDKITPEHPLWLYYVNHGSGARPDLYGWPYEGDQMRPSDSECGKSVAGMHCWGKGDDAKFYTVGVKSTIDAAKDWYKTILKHSESITSLEELDIFAKNNLSARDAATLRNTWRNANLSPEQLAAEGNLNNAQAQFQKEKDECDTNKVANNIVGATSWITCKDNGISVVAAVRAYCPSGKRFDNNGNCYLTGKESSKTTYDKEGDCEKSANNSQKCVPIQGNGGWLVVSESAPDALSYNSGASAGKPTTIEKQPPSSTHNESEKFEDNPFFQNSQEGGVNQPPIITPSGEDITVGEFIGGTTQATLEIGGNIAQGAGNVVGDINQARFDISARMVDIPQNIAGGAIAKYAEGRAKNIEQYNVATNKVSQFQIVSTGVANNVFVGLVKTLGSVNTLAGNKETGDSLNDFANRYDQASDKWIENLKQSAETRQEITEEIAKNVDEGGERIGEVITDFDKPSSYIEQAGEYTSRLPRAIGNYFGSIFDKAGDSANKLFSFMGLTSKKTQETIIEESGNLKETFIEGSSNLLEGESIIDPSDLNSEDVTPDGK